MYDLNSEVAVTRDKSSSPFEKNALVTGRAGLSCAGTGEMVTWTSESEKCEVWQLWRRQQNSQFSQDLTLLGRSAAWARKVVTAIEGFRPEVVAWKTSDELAKVRNLGAVTSATSCFGVNNDSMGGV
ncbi:hypothetical protein LTR95_002583 [Oleoguttula sp. CCFEE 5521]